MKTIEKIKEEYAKEHNLPVKFFKNVSTTDTLMQRAFNAARIETLEGVLEDMYGVHGSEYVIEYLKEQIDIAENGI